MRGRGHRAAGSRGFTLAELLVATVLLSFVMGSLYTLTHSTLGAWRSLDRGYDPYGEARNAVTAFRHEFENLIAGGDTIFEGTHDEITMLVLSEPFEIKEAGGIHMMKVRYYLKREREGMLTLMREERLAKGAVSSGEEENSRMMSTSRIDYDRATRYQMASMLSDFSIRYVWLPAEGPRQPGSPPQDMTPEYKTRHDKNWGFPQAVEISYTVGDPEGRRAPLHVRTVFPVRQTTARKSLRELIRLE